MREQCPHCGRPFGWRGPPYEVRTTGRSKAQATVRYACKACGVELEYRQSKTERTAWVVASASLFASFAGLILRDYFSVRISNSVLLIVMVLASISFAGAAFVWLRAQHFVAASDRTSEPTQ